MSKPLKHFSRRLSASQMRAQSEPQIQTQLQARLTAVAFLELFMGATVVTSKTVAAFRHPATGQVIYIPFESTYEKNCYPHTPSWGPRAIGTYEQVMSRVYASAAACEGGSLQIRSGQTKPETYLKSWRICFSEPFQMPDMEITLKLGGTSMYDSIPDTQVEASVAALERIGRHDLVEAMRAGPVQVSLHKDVDILIALYGVDTNLPLWKVIGDLPVLGYADESLAAPVAKGQVTMPTAVAYAVDKENVVVSINGGPLKSMGWRYSAIGKFICKVVLPIEMKASFSAYKLIREFRDILDAAPELPDNTVITVTPTNAEHSHYLSSAKKLAVKLGLFASVEDVPETYETTFGAVRELSEEYLLSTLEDGQVAWTMAPSVDVTMLHSVDGAGQVHQLGLF
jgi:hypothetical protein